MKAKSMSKVSTNINLDPELKKSCQELFADLGLDLTTAVTIFLKQALRVQGLPFTVGREIPNEETKVALDDYKQMKEHPERYKVYDDFKSLMGNALSEE